MKLSHLIVREIRHRAGSFLLATISVAVATGCLSGSLALLETDKAVTEEILSQKQNELESSLDESREKVAAAGAALNDEMRKITKGLGFNILILPERQDVNELLVDGTLSETMPEEYATRLAESDIVTVNHLLPIVTAKTRWEEVDQTVLLTGTRGEIPFLHRAQKKPLQDQVPAGTMVVGYRLHSQLGLKTGQKVEFHGREFTVTELFEERGTVDDMTVWINLKEAQEILGSENLINAILALECNCASADRVGEIRKDVAGILPGTQIIEKGPPALARAEARNQAAKASNDALAQEEEAAAATLENERTSREMLYERHASFAEFLVPLIIVAAGASIGVLTLSNVRSRVGEIAILRTIGLRTSQIISLFLGKAILVGLLGGVFGYVLGISFGHILSRRSLHVESLLPLFEPGLAALIIGMALLLSAAASWIPAILAARRDPATVLQVD